MQSYLEIQKILENILRILGVHSFVVAVASVRVPEISGDNGIVRGRQEFPDVDRSVRVGCEDGLFAVLVNGPTWDPRRDHSTAGVRTSRDLVRESRGRPSRPRCRLLRLIRCVGASARWGLGTLECVQLRWDYLECFQQLRKYRQVV